MLRISRLLLVVLSMLAFVSGTSSAHYSRNLKTEADEVTAEKRRQDLRGITVRVSTLWRQDVDPRDTRQWIAPQVRAELSSEDYRTNNDPAPKAIISYTADANTADKETADGTSKNYDNKLARTDRKPIEDTLIGLEKQSWEAWKKRDSRFFHEFLSDDHVEIGSSGTATKAQIVAFVGSPLCVVKGYKVDKFVLTIFSANTALLTYYAEQDTTCNNTPVPSPAWASSLYVKRDGRWLNALYQQTPTSRK